MAKVRICNNCGDRVDSPKVQKRIEVNVETLGFGGARFLATTEESLDFCKLDCLIAWAIEENTIKSVLKDDGQ